MTFYNKQLKNKPRKILLRVNARCPCSAFVVAMLGRRVNGESHFFLAPLKVFKLSVTKQLSCALKRDLYVLPSTWHPAWVSRKSGLASLGQHREKLLLVLLLSGFLKRARKEALSRMSPTPRNADRMEEVTDGRYHYSMSNLEHLFYVVLRCTPCPQRYSSYCCPYR